MDSENRKKHNIPMLSLLGLALLGVPHKVLEVFEVLEMGSTLNFIVLLIAPILWVILVRKKAKDPLFLLLTIGGIYGLLSGVIAVFEWINFEAPLDLGRSNWSFDDLLTAIEYYLTPGARFIGQILLGIFIGFIAGLAARMINNSQLKKNR